MARNHQEHVMRYFGIDVSRDRLDCAAINELGERSARPRSFANDADGVRSLIIWVLAHDPGQARQVVMEATAAYHELAATRLHFAGVVVAVVNAAKVRSLARGLGMLSKTDLIDALVLAQYARLAQPRSWQPADLPLQQFNAMLMRLDALEANLRRELNRLDQAELRATSTYVMDSLNETIAFLRRQCTAMRRAISAHVRTNETLKVTVERLRTIPAIGEKSANRMAALLGTNAFTSAKQAAAFLGLIPVKTESGVSVKGRTRLSKAGNPRIRASLYMAAIVAKRINPDVKALYDRLTAAGKTKMSALGACMRKLVHLCYGVTKSGRDYVPNAGQTSQSVG
jgi:transposase